MKIRIVYFFFLFGIFLLGSACQDEFTEIIEPPVEEAFTGGSGIADLIEKTAQKDGSPDNIIDRSSCLTVVLPVEVTVNGIILQIEREDDFAEIEKILDASSEDDDVLEIKFPIVVITSEYEEEEIESMEELADAAADCIENGLDEDIECLDFIYPLTFSVYDSDNSIANTVQVFADEELFQFIEDLEENEFVSLNFPVDVILYDGEQITINDNLELEEIINQVADSCDEDDDNDFDEDDVDDTELRSALVVGVWEIKHYFKEEDLTQKYQGYHLQFEEDELLFASVEEKLHIGEWETSGDAGYLELEIDFEADELLEEISGEWDVLDFNQEEIILVPDIDDYDDNGNSNSKTQLILSKSEEVTNPIKTVSDYIVNGEWAVTKFINDLEDETSEFADYIFSFFEDLTVNAASESQDSDGSWEEVFEGDEHKLILHLNEPPLDEISEDWTVYEFSESRIQLIDSEILEDATSELVFEKK